MQACDRCHARKTRCDRRIPRCSACDRAGAPCLHADKLRQRYMPRGYVDTVESQVQTLTEENARLRRELAALRTRSPAVDAHPTAAVDSGNEQAAQQPRSEPAQRPAEDPVTTEVGYLSLKATGETRYLGSSSGIGLAGLISAMVDIRAGASQLLSDSTQADDHASLAVGDSADGSIPPLQAVMPFIQAYFRHTHITFPLIHRPTFLRTVERIYAEPDFYASNPYDAFAFDMVLSIASSNFNHFGDASASFTHYARARAMLPAVLAMPGLVPLRAILLLSQHGIFSNLKDTSASIWHLVGMGVRICYEMGLHVEPKRQGTLCRPATHVTFEKEMERRCFWCLYNLDRVTSFTLGRPAAIRDDDIDVPLPSHLDDESFGPDRPIPIDSSNERRISPFLHLIRARRLSGQILATLYCANQNSTLTYEQKRHVRRDFHKKLDAWRDDTRLLGLSSEATNAAGCVSSFVCPEWYAAVYNNAMLLLYRPSPYFPHPMNSSSQTGEEEDLLHLYSAAKSTIHAYAELHSRRCLNYSWITLHGVFIAGLAYVYCIGCALNGPNQAFSLPDYLDIIDDTRACSNILVAICERWNVVRRSCELFNRLSNAVIRDAVNAATRRKAPPAWNNDAVFQRSRNATQPTGHAQIQNNKEMTDLDSFLDPGMMNDSQLMDHVFVADEFRNYFDDLDNAFLGDKSFPSELLMGFSQDWPFPEFGI